MNSSCEKDFAIEMEDGECIKGVIRDTGQGPVGVFVHGLRSHADGEKSMFLWERAIENNRSWIRFDLRGHGKSDGEFDSFRISRTVRDLESVLNQVRDRKIVLVGSSLGGWISAYVASKRKYKIRGALLIAPAFNFIEGIFKSMSSENRQKWRQEGHFRFESPHDDSDFTFEYPAIEDSRQFDLFKSSFAYQHPVIILHGENDEAVPVGQSFRFQQHAASEVQVEVVPGGDHRLTSHIQRISELVDNLWQIQ